MAIERDLQPANVVLRDFRSRIGHRGSRIHQDTMWRNLLKQRALDGLCGSCNNLDITFKGAGVSQSVALNCPLHDPVGLYANVLSGSDVSCPDFTPDD